MHPGKNHTDRNWTLLGQIFFFCWIGSVGLNSCKQPNQTEPISRTWIGPEYWANPLQDWELRNDSILCNVARPQRDLHLLTHEISDREGYFETSTIAQILNDLPPSDDNWIGFNIGKKGQFQDYRDDAIYGIGTEVGVTTKGMLFVRTDETLLVGKKNIDPEELRRGLWLSLSVNDDGSGHCKLNFHVVTLEGDTLQTLGSNDLKSARVEGSYSIVSHFNQARDEAEVPGTAFTRWQSSGSKLDLYKEREFGPLLFAQYTQHRQEVKLTVQLMPVGQNDDKGVVLELMKGGEWTPVKTSGIDPMSRTAHFRFPHPIAKEDVPFRALYGFQDLSRGNQTDTLSGTIKAEPAQQNEIVVAAMSCNRDLGFPANDLVDALKFHQPDLLFFGGDQIYESTGKFGVQRRPTEKATLDYLRKWYQFGWAYGALTNHIPTVSITDDHDVFHGNLWGEGGHAIPDSLGQGAKAQDFGGYKMPPDWVNMVQRSQTWHLPDAVDPDPIDQDIDVYFTELRYGGISFAIVEDRKWKSAPKKHLPEADIYNGWPHNTSWDAKTLSDVDGTTLLGERQHRFLEDWSKDWKDGIWMKVLLSQTIFHNIGTLPESAIDDGVVPSLRIMKPGEFPPDDRPVSDFDSNGWPQKGRNRAIRTLRKGFGFHIAGDQHLGSTSQYGVETYEDGGFAFCVPAISNIWPRRWFPAIPGLNPFSIDLKITGGFLDGFGNKMTVHAVANPVFTGREPLQLYDRAAGYGIVKFDKETRNIRMECWPRFQDFSAGDTAQYRGWPIEINQVDNYGKEAVSFLPEIEVIGMEDPVLEIVEERTGDHIYTLRIQGSSFRPKVFNPGTYQVTIGEEKGRMKVLNLSTESESRKITVSFD